MHFFLTQGFLDGNILGPCHFFQEGSDWAFIVIGLDIVDIGPFRTGPTSAQETYLPSPSPRAMAGRGQETAGSAAASGAKTPAAITPLPPLSPLVPSPAHLTPPLLPSPKPQRERRREGDGGAAVRSRREPTGRGARHLREDGCRRGGGVRRSRPCGGLPGEGLGRWRPLPLLPLRARRPWQGERSFLVLSVFFRLLYTDLPMDLAIWGGD